MILGWVVCKGKIIKCNKKTLDRKLLIAILLLGKTLNLVVYCMSGPARFIFIYYVSSSAMYIFIPISKTRIRSITAELEYNVNCRMAFVLATSSYRQQHDFPLAALSALQKLPVIWRGEESASNLANSSSPQQAAPPDMSFLNSNSFLLQ